MKKEAESIHTYIFNSCMLKSKLVYTNFINMNMLKNTNLSLSLCTEKYFHTANVAAYFNLSFTMLVVVLDDFHRKKKEHASKYEYDKLRTAVLF